MSSEYEELKKKLDADCRKQEARARILRGKRDERRAIKKGGGGHKLAQAILGGKRMADDTDFNFGANVPSESIDERIAREQAERCMEKVYCPACKRYHGYCAEIAEEKERLKMLPTGDSSNNNRSRNQQGLPFINPEDLTTQPQECKILMVKFTEKKPTNKTASVTLKVAFKGEMRYVWMPCQMSDPRFKLLINTYGADENNWVNERFCLHLEEDEFGSYDTKKKFNQIMTIPASTEKKGARK